MLSTSEPASRHWRPHRRQGRPISPGRVSFAERPHGTATSAAPRRHRVPNTGFRYPHVNPPPEPASLQVDADRYIYAAFSTAPLAAPRDVGLDGTFCHQATLGPPLRGLRIRRVEVCVRRRGIHSFTASWHHTMQIDAICTHKLRATRHLRDCSAPLCGGDFRPFRCKSMKIDTYTMAIRWHHRGHLGDEHAARARRASHCIVPEISSRNAATIPRDGCGHAGALQPPHVAPSVLSSAAGSSVATPSDSAGSGRPCSSHSGWRMGQKRSKISRPAQPISPSTAAA